MRLKDRLRRFLGRRHSTVLVYHSVLARPAPFAMWQHADVEAFEAQIALLASECRCVPVSVLADEIRRGRREPYTACLTFDDGFANNLHVVLPILETYRVPATFCIATRPLDAGSLLWPEEIACIVAATNRGEAEYGGVRLDFGTPGARAASYRLLTRMARDVAPARMDAALSAIASTLGVERAALPSLPLWEQLRMLRPDELRTLAASPWVQIGAHTVNHWRLALLDDASARAEIVESRRRLEELVGRVTCFAYPHGGPGDYGEVHCRMARDAGFETILTSSCETVTDATSPFALPRIPIGSDLHFDQFRYTLRGGAASLAGRLADAS